MRYKYYYCGKLICKINSKIYINFFVERKYDGSKNCPNSWKEKVAESWTNRAQNNESIGGRIIIINRDDQYRMFSTIDLLPFDGRAVYICVGMYTMRGFVAGMIRVCT